MNNFNEGANCYEDNFSALKQKSNEVAFKIRKNDKNNFFKRNRIWFSDKISIEKDEFCENLLFSNLRSIKTFVENKNRQKDYNLSIWLESVRNNLNKLESESDFCSVIKKISFLKLSSPLFDLLTFQSLFDEKEVLLILDCLKQILAGRHIENSILFSPERMNLIVDLLKDENVKIRENVK